MPEQKPNAFLVATIQSLIARDLRMAKNDGDLKQRLASLGYGFRDTRCGRVLTTVPHGVELFALPAKTSNAIS